MADNDWLTQLYRRSSLAGKLLFHWYRLKLAVSEWWHRWSAEANDG